MEKYKIGYRDNGKWFYLTLICEHNALMHMCITLLAEGCDKVSISKVERSSSDAIQ